MKKNKILFIMFGFSILALAACAPTFQSVPAAAPGQDAVITVTGTGAVSVVPDIASINVGVRSTGDTVTEALEANNIQAETIKATLISEGVDEMDIQTSSFNVYPLSDYDYDGNVTRTYFSVENYVYVKVKDLDTLGDILDAVARSGANNIYGIDFNVQEKTEAQSSARQLAVDSAKAQAQELADAAGVELGEIVAISSSYSYPAYYSGYGMGGGGSDLASSYVPTTSGQIQIVTDVTMTFAIK
jgi:uncharacterized protein